ncbi:MAG: bifunctional 5,10-methylenetetrahydrofolate dehydrogenase/5,10-methenyltetrahydrofolate cyclohydrolase, partial [Syntrophomonadaceae bacterium]|nr:bifunctional 5,10-methylenetetrahydrofolate dehydrogenase/5,10-methenyltetrahydrofolate cyclohydrolase [Syntrophomonadaceae bacterium]
MMQLISGKSIADEIKNRLREENAANRLVPHLAIINVGQNQENLVYIRLKEQAVAVIGGKCRTLHLPEDTEREKLLQEISLLNTDPDIDGILLQLPISKKLDNYQEEFLSAIDITKDVDGFNPVTLGRLLRFSPGFISCGALACLEILERYLDNLKGKQVTLVGDSFDIILPLSIILTKKGCNVHVLPEYIPQRLPESDGFIFEKGAPLVVKREHINPGAVIIDAGFYWHDNRSCGNVDREALAEAEGYLAPVPGGIGPILIAKLMENLTAAAKSRRGLL